MLRAWSGPCLSWGRKQSQFWISLRERLAPLCSPSSRHQHLGRSVLPFLLNTPDVKFITCLRHTWLTGLDSSLRDSCNHSVSLDSSVFQRRCALSTWIDPCWFLFTPLSSALASLSPPILQTLHSQTSTARKATMGGPERLPARCFRRCAMAIAPSFGRHGKLKHE